MPSLKSRLVAAYLRHTRKKAFRSAEGLNAWIARARTFETHRPPVGVARRVAITQHEVAGRPVYEVRPTGGVRSDQRILYFHGGAYVFEITRFHWKLIAEIVERTGMQITVPIYPIAPEHRFEDIFAMVRAVYRRLLERVPAGRIVFMGDSAGGNMAVVLAMMAAQEGWPLPSRMALISPGLDMTLENPALVEAASADPWLDIAGGIEALRHYAPGMDPADWRISPINGDLSVLPPTLILAGGSDMLTLDTVRFAEKASLAGAEVELVVEPGMIHVWPLIDMPEAIVARQRIVAWLNGEPAENLATARHLPGIGWLRRVTFRRHRPSSASPS
jgi:acetyl esterase/lipase